VVVIGGGPAGLATALMLARRGYSNVKVRPRTEAAVAAGAVNATCMWHT
jgi:2-polyprenyl-6-methoxyphenol hydroxylase-like FAD-dependent oxidoreductase